MPWESKKQQRWGHGEGGKKAGLDVEEWDDKTDFESLPEEAEAGKGPCRTPGPGKKLPEKVKDARRSSREVNEGMPKGGFHSKKGYNRKEKHPKDHAEGEELTMVDETYRGMNFPFASTLNWGRGAPLAASLDWSSHKSETFDDTGKDGGHPAWGLKSIIDRGVKPHEKPAGDKRIADDQTTNRSNGEGKKFKAYSMAGAFTWK
jgi:hypothetical protein